MQKYIYNEYHLMIRRPQKGITYNNQIECMRCALYYYANMMHIEDITGYIVCPNCDDGEWPQQDYPVIPPSNLAPPVTQRIDKLNDAPVCTNNSATMGIGTWDCAIVDNPIGPYYGPLNQFV